MDMKKQRIVGRKGQGGSDVEDGNGRLETGEKENVQQEQQQQEPQPFAKDERKPYEKSQTGPDKKTKPHNCCSRSETPSSSERTLSSQHEREKENERDVMTISKDERDL